MVTNRSQETEKEVHFRALDGGQAIQPGPSKPWHVKVKSSPYLCVRKGFALQLELGFLARVEQRN
jgi:hypothetical protein